MKRFVFIGLLASCAAPALAATTPVPHFSISETRVTEGGDLVFTITKDRKGASYSKIQFGVVDFGDPTLSGAAGIDYVPTGGVLLTFGNNTLSMTVHVKTLPNEKVDGTRRVIGRIAPVRYSIIDRSSAVGQILDDDVAPPPAPPPTQTCPDGTVISAASTCPPPAPPPPPASHTCPDGTVIDATAVCPTPAPPPPTPIPSQVCADGSEIPATMQCPVVPPPTPSPPSGYVPSPTLAGLPAIPDNFDPELARKPIGLNAAGYSAPSAAPDNVGAFRFICEPGQVLADDPIAFPGQPGRSHLHQFYGNTAANARSTYDSLRTTGDSTCNLTLKGFALNRSAYWMPAMLDGKGNVVKPNYITVYYKRQPKDSAFCNDKSKTLGCVMQPNGLRWIIGRNMSNLTAKTMVGAFHFGCIKPSGEALHKVAGDLGSYPQMGDVLSFCPSGQGWQLMLMFDGPECWDGKNLDTPDHRSHVAMFVRRAGDGAVTCPSTHPYTIPVFRLGANYSLLAGDVPTDWRLSSDAMDPTGVPGATAHLDLFDAWSSITKPEWTDFCIDKFLSCAGANLGDGFMLLGNSPRWGFGTIPNRLLPTTDVPVTP